ncbi:universal stress protein [Kitasatospora camelliae]|uniref:Universal stress protein n=1 Tax=Kitasatospora camelliae TaxID=3156397 RepID=A0AAU8JQJ7_9ACTN
MRSTPVPERGRIYQRCGCRDALRRQLGTACPRLIDPDHGSWVFAVDAPSPDGHRRTLAPAVTASLGREVATEAMERFTDTLDPWRGKYPDVEVVASLLSGSTAATLVEATGRPDLLVVGRRNRTGALGAHLGPVAQAAVHHVHSPLAVVPFG